MYVGIVTELIKPILLSDINKVEVRQINKNNNEFEVIILAPKDFFKKLVGKNGVIIQSLTTIVNAKAKMQNERVKISIKEL